MRRQASGLGRSARAAFVTALLLPYLLIQSIAAGVMPVMTDDGLTFVICSGQRIDNADHGGPEGNETVPHADGGTCPWVVAHAPVALSGAPGASRLATPARSFAESEAGPDAPHSGATVSPPVRAPPVLV